MTSRNILDSDALASDDPAFEEILQSTSYGFNQLPPIDENDFVFERPKKISQAEGSSSISSTFTSTASTVSSVSSRPGPSSSITNYHSYEDKDYPQWKIQNEADISSLRRKNAALREELGKNEALILSLEYEDDERKAKYRASLNTGQSGAIMGQSLKKKSGRIDYANNVFEWDGVLKDTMRKIFKIEEFRLCQRGVCNSNMDGRDIVVVMPTGGGKSLTYQLPAVLTPGVTLVISPLISLISDQIMHLREAGVEAVKLTGSTPKSEQDSINARLGNMAKTSGQGSNGGKDIKLLYCTPEKIAKSKRFVSLLQKLSDADRLTRIVIDEAHCVSALGHDFRPDYQRLHILRQLFPNVPIMALSATCPPLVLKDLLKVLKLKATVPGEDADRTGTVYFTAPLYRPNLHYQVLPKASEGTKVYAQMAAWILKEHPNDSGIVYCLSKKDTEKVATELAKGGEIRTGVYHADRSDSEKDKLHRDWHRGDVQVVCATIAFGLGIDKGNVRFVIHHSISKSLDGFYQESGRAGRDGKDSDCVLFYRAQDASTLSSMTMGDKDGGVKLNAMLEFAQNLTECRKIQFANYFSHTTNLSMTSWSTSDASARERCGHCDNCTRNPEAHLDKDVTLETWQLLRIIEKAQKTGENVTLAKVVELARSSGKAFFGTGRKGKHGGAKEQTTVNLDAICGGKVGLKKEEIEILLVHLGLKRYLKDQFYTTAYSTIAYVQLGERAAQLTRYSSKDQLESLPNNSRIWCSFRVQQAPKKRTGRPPGSKNTKTVPSSARAGKGKAKAKPLESDMDGDSDPDAPGFVSDIDDHDDEVDLSNDKPDKGKGKAADSASRILPISTSKPQTPPLQTLTTRKRKRQPVVIISDVENDDDEQEGERNSGDEDDEEEGTGDWIVPYSKKPSPSKRPRIETIIELFDSDENIEDPG